MSLLFARCSKMCADQPVMREQTNRGVKSGVGTPMKWYIDALKKSAFAKSFFSSHMTFSMISEIGYRTACGWPAESFCAQLLLIALRGSLLRYTAWPKPMTFAFFAR